MHSFHKIDHNMAITAFVAPTYDESIYCNKDSVNSIIEGKKESVICLTFFESRIDHERFLPLLFCNSNWS